MGKIGVAHFAELMKSQFDIATELPHLDDTIVL